MPLSKPSRSSTLSVGNEIRNVRWSREGSRPRAVSALSTLRVADPPADQQAVVERAARDGLPPPLTMAATATSGRRPLNLRTRRKRLAAEISGSTCGARTAIASGQTMLVPTPSARSA